MPVINPFLIPDETGMRDLGASLIASAEAGTVITLQGELGTGKTTLVRGALHACGVSGAVRSPTYTLVEFYPLQKMSIAHFDLYRLSDPEELEYLGYRDYLNPQTLCFIEWPEQARGYLQGVDLEIRLAYDSQGRQVEFQAQSSIGQEVIDRFEKR